MATAAVCIVVAGVLLWRRDFNYAFVVAVLGIVAWFLNYRIQMKAITDAADEQRAREIQTDDDDE